MGRMARVVVPGLAHHVTQRGNHQQDVFFCDSDRGLYLRLLADYSQRYQLRLLGYCLMTNHVHLIVVPEGEGSLAKAIGRTHNDYSRWLHVRQRRTGHLWQNRFSSCVLQDRHLWEALRYVETNPVRARMVERAWEWRWSSAQAHCCGEDDSRLLDMRLWQEWHSPRGWQEALELGWADAVLAARIREATRSGRPMAEAGFVESLEERLRRMLRPRKRGPKPRMAAEGRQISLGIS